MTIHHLMIYLGLGAMTSAVDHAILKEGCRQAGEEEHRPPVWWVAGVMLLWPLIWATWVFILVHCMAVRR